jgi:hypothetical protein
MSEFTIAIQESPSVTIADWEIFPGYCSPPHAGPRLAPSSPLSGRLAAVAAGLAAAEAEFLASARREFLAFLTGVLETLRTDGEPPALAAADWVSWLVERVPAGWGKTRSLASEAGWLCTLLDFLPPSHPAALAAKAAEVLARAVVPADGHDRPLGKALWYEPRERTEARIRHQNARNEKRKEDRKKKREAGGRWRK